MILVVAAMPEEVARILPPAASSPRSAVVTCGFGGRPIAIAVTGEGDVCAARGIHRALAQVRPSAVVAIGFSGALRTGLEPGALIVAAEVRRQRDTFAASGPAMRRAAELTGARPGVVITHQHVLTAARDKARLAATLPAACALPAVVDLESASYVAAAVRARLPWLVLRAVSDLADESLPRILGRCRDARGAMRRRAIVGRSLLTPWIWPALWKLQRRSRVAAESLAAGVEALVASWPTAS